MTIATDDSGTVEDRLHQLRTIQRVNAVVFWIAVVGILGGFALGVADLELGDYLFIAGVICLAVSVISSFALMPFLRCPGCHRRFFVPGGVMGFIARIDVHNHRCVHCGLVAQSRRCT